MARRSDGHVAPAGRDATPAGQPPIRPGWWRTSVVPAALLVAMACAAHAPALRGGFVWDDDVYVTANPHLGGASGLADIWFRPRSILQDYPGRGIDALIPLTFTTLWVEHRLWGLDPLGYHLVNLALHALAAVLLWRLLRRLGARGAWLGAAIFAVHPVTVESVAWVAELKNVQSAVLGLLCLLAFFRFRPVEEREGASGGHRRRFLALALLLFGAALLTKAAVVTLPVVILLVVWWKRGRLRSGDLAAVAPMLAMGGAMGLLTVLAEDPSGGSVGAGWQASALEKTVVAGRAVWFYAGKLVWPHPLVSIYPRWEVAATVGWQALFPLAALATLVGLWALRRRLGRGPLAAALGFVVMVGPTLGLVDVAYHLYSFVADHFQYHAAPALIALLAAGAAALGDRVGQGRRALAAAAAGALLVGLGSLTFRHALTFCSEKARCLHTLAHNPGAWLAANNLGVVLAAEGKPQEAIRHYEEALRVRPGYAEAHNNLGVALAALGKLGDAVAQYRAALQIWPAYAAAHNNLGAALASQGRVEEAVKEYREALRSRPRYAEAHKNLGTALAAAGDLEAAVGHFREALRIRPGYAEARSDLGVALASAGRVDEAIGQYLEALRSRPDDARTCNNLGTALAAAGRTAEAIRWYREALRLQPDFAEAANNLGTALGSQGQVEEAIRLLREAVRISPGYAEAHHNLGAALASGGHLQEAMEQFREAVRLRPDYADAHLNLGTALASAGALAEAVPHFQAVLRVRAGSTEAHNGLGVSLAGLGRLDEAIGHFEQALRIDPGDAGARSNLERARALAGRTGSR